MAATEQTNPWDRQPDEPILWFSRFERFRSAGPERSLLATFKEFLASQSANQHPGDAPTRRPPQTIPGSWSQAQSKWDWRARAEAWDEAEIDRERALFERNRRRNKAQRIQILQAYMGKLAQALPGVDYTIEKIRADSYGPLINGVMRELRAEYNDEPTQRQEHAGPGGGVLTIAMLKQAALAAETEQEPLVLNEHGYDPMAGVSVPSPVQDEPGGEPDTWSTGYRESSEP